MVCSRSISKASIIGFSFSFPLLFCSLFLRRYKRCFFFVTLWEISEIITMKRNYLTYSLSAASRPLNKVTPCSERFLLGRVTKYECPVLQQPFFIRPFPMRYRWLLNSRSRVMPFGFYLSTILFKSFRHVRHVRIHLWSIYLQLCINNSEMRSSNFLN